MTTEGFNRVETDVLTALEAMYGSEEATNLLGDYSNALLFGERLLHATQDRALRDVNARAPRWDEDPIVISQGWLDGRCARCGEAHRV